MFDQRAIAVILGGGAGTRLFPLTQQRSKPAVPIAGKFRLIDVPISNCLNSEIFHIFILTQFNSGSLNQHVSRTYSMPPFMQGFVEVLAATLTPNNPNWYQGTADAVRQNLWYLLRLAQREKAKRVLILSGDHLYRMDYRKLIQFHMEHEAEITVSVLAVDRDDVPGFGIVQVSPELEVVRFVEKPRDPELIDSLRFTGSAGEISVPKERPFLASMGIYVFEVDVLQKLLESTEDNDFGKEVLPKALGKQRMFAYPYDGYWRDIGTIRSYYQANLEMCDFLPQFDFFPSESLFYTRVRQIPPAKIQQAKMERVLLSDGVRVGRGCEISHSALGQRLMVHEGARLERAVLFGGTRFERGYESNTSDLPRMGIGEGSSLKNCIVDKDVRIGRDVVIEGAEHYPDFDDPQGRYYLRDGLVIVPRKAVIPDGMQIPIREDLPL
ncbi:MAG: sugar phosphate nucleotidyltransferase [Myxococcota bacterium]